MFLQMKNTKKAYLDRMQTSEKYRHKESSKVCNYFTNCTIDSVDGTANSKLSTIHNSKFQFCSSGNKEVSKLMNIELMQDDIMSRKESYKQINPNRYTNLYYHNFAAADKLVAKT